MDRTFEVRADNRGYVQKERFVVSADTADAVIAERIRELCQLYRQRGFSITEVVEVLHIPNTPLSAPSPKSTTP